MGFFWERRPATWVAGYALHPSGWPAAGPSSATGRGMVSFRQVFAKATPETP